MSVLSWMIRNCQWAALFVAVKAFLFPTSYQRLVSKCPQQPSRRRYDVSRWKTDRSYLGSLLHIRPDLLPQQQWEGLHPCEQQSRNHDISDEIIKQWGYPVHRWSVHIESWWRHHNDYRIMADFHHQSMDGNISLLHGSIFDLSSRRMHLWTTSKFPIWFGTSRS